MKRLVLENVHRKLGASLGEAYGFHLPQSYGSPEREVDLVRSAAGVLDQSYRGVLDLEGADAGEALNRVLSSAVSALEPGAGQSSCLLSAKGRVIGAFFLYRCARDGYRLIAMERMRSELEASIRKYVLLGGIEVTDRSSEVAIVSVQGVRAGDVLSAAGAPALPDRERRQVVAAEIAAAACQVTPGGETPEGGFEVWAPAASLEDVWRVLHRAASEVGGGAVGHAAAEVLRVEAGQCRYGADYDEDSFPNEIGWEHALTYDKCYVGQEIVARMRTYGEVNRRIRGLLVAGDVVPAPGTRVESGDEEAGSITSSVVSKRLGRVLALARLKRKFWEEPTLTVAGRSGGAETMAAEQVDLPFVRLDQPP